MIRATQVIKLLYSFCLLTLIIIFGSTNIFSDSVIVDNIYYENIYFRGSGNSYQILFPETGEVIKLSSDKIDYKSIIYSPPLERIKLLQMWENSPNGKIYNIEQEKKQKIIDEQKKRAEELIIYDQQVQQRIKEEAQIKVEEEKNLQQQILEQRHTEEHIVTDIANKNMIQDVQKTPIRSNSESISEDKFKKQENKLSNKEIRKQSNDDYELYVVFILILIIVIFIIITVVFAKRNKVVIWYDTKDLFLTLVIPFSLLCQIIIIIIVAGNKIDVFLFSIHAAISWILFIIFFIAFIISVAYNYVLSVKYNRSFVKGVWSGTFKLLFIFITPLIYSSSFSMLKQNTGNDPESIRKDEIDNRRSKYFILFLLSLLYYMLVNGEKVYKQNGWPLK